MKEWIKTTMRKILQIKVISFIFFIVITIFSLLGWNGAKLTNEILVLCGFIFLLSVFPDLKSWNLWGFRGENRDLSSIPENGGLDTRKAKPNQSKVEKAENQPLQLMDNSKGNFLALAFEIERLLRILATVTLAKDIPSTANPKKLVDDLKNIGMITEVGKQQIDAIRWIRNLLVHGRESEINQDTLNQGIKIALNFYTEIFNWLNNTNNQSEK